MLLAVFVAALLVAINSRESQTVTEPYYAPLLGAVLHLPPYAMKEMAIDVHCDRGWPIWHTRRSESFAAQNAALYLSDDRRQLATPDAPSTTDWFRAGFDVVIALSIIAIVVTMFELVSRRVRAARERLAIIDPTSNAN